MFVVPPPSYSSLRIYLFPSSPSSSLLFHSIIHQFIFFKSNFQKTKLWENGMVEIQIDIHPNPSCFIIWIRLLVICGRRRNQVGLYHFRFFISFSYQSIVVVAVRLCASCFSDFLLFCCFCSLTNNSSFCDVLNQFGINFYCLESILACFSSSVCVESI